MAVTKIADVIVPEIFTPYVQQQTMVLNAFIASGVVSVDEQLNALLAGAGLTFNLPSWLPLADTDENMQSDDDTVNATPNKTSATKEIGVRLSRHNSWSAMNLTTVLAGADPMTSIGNQVSNYWAQRLQKAVIATIQGVYADNAAAPAGTDTHTQNDMTNDISGNGYVAGVTDFSAEAVIDTLITMGDGLNELTAVCMHSIVYAKALKNNLIDFVPDSSNPSAADIPVFLRRRVIIDDGLPNPAGSGAAATSTGIYHTWLFGAGAMRYGVGTPEVPTEFERLPRAGNGGGQDILHNRVEWMIHPTGYRYVGTAPNSGPDNTSNANMLAAAASWSRIYPQRKQIKMARLITRESA